MTPKPSASPIPVEIELPDERRVSGNGWQIHILQMSEVSIFVFVIPHYTELPSGGSLFLKQS